MSRNIKEEIITKALNLGFADVGFTKPKILHNDIHKMQKWIENKHYADMNWITKNIEERGRPPVWVKTIIVFVMPYHPLIRKNGEKFYASYADGSDYHTVIKKKIETIANTIMPFGSRIKICVDTSRIFEKAYARESGLGFIGKNMIFISNKRGPFVNLGLLLTEIEIEIEPVEMRSDGCSTCSKCIKKCPSAALSNNGLDARKCISWLTIEKKSKLTKEEKKICGSWIFGCDICLEVCPYSSRSLPKKEPTVLAHQILSR